MPSYPHNTYAAGQSLFAEHLNADLDAAGVIFANYETRISALESNLASLTTRVSNLEGTIRRRVIPDLGPIGATPSLTMLSTDITVWLTGTINTDGTVFTINNMIDNQAVRLFFVQDSVGGHDVSLTESGVTKDLRGLDTIPGNSTSIECLKVNGTLWVQVI